MLQNTCRAFSAMSDSKDFRAINGQSMLLIAAIRWFKSHGGAGTRRAPEGEAEAPQTAGRGNWPEAVPKTHGQNGRNFLSRTSNRGEDIGEPINHARQRERFASSAGRGQFAQMWVGECVRRSAKRSDRGRAYLAFPVVKSPRLAWLRRSKDQSFPKRGNVRYSEISNLRLRRSGAPKRFVMRV